jgi:hypothetical protein
MTPLKPERRSRIKNRFPTSCLLCAGLAHDEDEDEDADEDADEDGLGGCDPDEEE